MNVCTASSLFLRPISSSSPHFCLHVITPMFICLLGLSLGLTVAGAHYSPNLFLSVLPVNSQSASSLIPHSPHQASVSSFPGWIWSLLTSQPSFPFITNTSWWAPWSYTCPSLQFLLPVAAGSQVVPLTHIWVSHLKARAASLTLPKSHTVYRASPHPQLHLFISFHSSFPTLPPAPALQLSQHATNSRTYLFLLLSSTSSL